MSRSSSTNPTPNPTIDKKIRKCIKCDRDFESVNDRRMCPRCKKALKKAGMYSDYMI